MADKAEQVCHQGIVVEADKEKVIVKILSQSACAACHAKAACNMTEMAEKLIEVSNSGKQHFRPGDQVTVAMRESLGMVAVILAYFVPFLIVIVALFLFSHITGSEWMAGLLSLLLLPPYYLLLYRFRQRFKKIFSFEIKD